MRAGESIRRPSWSFLVPQGKGLGMPRGVGMALAASTPDLPKGQGCS